MLILTDDGQLFQINSESKVLKSTQTDARQVAVYQNTIVCLVYNDYVEFLELRDFKLIKRLQFQ